MSAILDALRKLQRERERGSQTLRESLLADPPAPHQSRWVAWVATGSFVALSGVALTLLFLGDGADDALDPRPATTASRPSSGPSLPADAVRGRALNQDGPASGFPLHERPPLPKPGFTRQRFANQERNAARMLLEQRAREAAERAEVVSEQRTSARVTEAEPLSMRHKLAASLAAAIPDAHPPVRLARAEPARAAVPVADKPKPAEQPVPRAEPERELPQQTVAEPEAEPVAPLDDAGAFRFPEFRLESVRWHPDVARREARLLVDGALVVDTRQGDVVAGVEIERIDPGAVQLRLGTAMRRIRLGP